MEVKRAKESAEFLPIAALGTVSDSGFTLTAEDFKGVEPLTDAQLKAIKRAGEDTVIALSINSIVVCHRFNNRQYRDPKAQELVYKGIKNDGQNTPCAIKTVEWNGETYAFLTAGFGRAQAVSRINNERGPNEKETKLKVVYRGDNNAQALLRNIRENVERSDISNLDKAAGALALMSQYGMTQGQVATTYNVSQATISQLLKLNRLTKFWKDRLFARQIGEGQARAIAEKDWDEKDPSKNLAFQEELRVKVENHLTANSPDISKKMVEQEVIPALENKVAGAAAAGSVIRWARDTMAKTGVSAKVMDLARAIAAFETAGDKTPGAKEAFEAELEKVAYGNSAEVGAAVGEVVEV